jgi:hypothetical protein
MTTTVVETMVFRPGPFGWIPPTLLWCPVCGHHDIAN